MLIAYAKTTGISGIYHVFLLSALHNVLFRQYDSPVSEIAL